MSAARPGPGGAPDAHTRELLAFAERLADEARKLLTAAALDAVRPDVKADNSYVTATDRLIENRLRELIGDAHPGHGVLGEEFGAHGLDADYVWVLDPLDGTAPFVAGIPVYGTLIGLAREGSPWIGVMDYPVTEDRWTGVDGAFAHRNGVPVRTRPCTDLATALATCSNPDFFTAPDHARLARVRARVQYTLYGASSYAFGLLAAGRTDLAVDSGLKPYDVFAPAAVISGAGGRTTQWSGAPLDLTTTGTFLSTGDPSLHASLLPLLR
jgi:inositol-phosphate phosphatase/L-galactose 1-phosphate phosphatase/histidinol-phosphatase